METTALTIEEILELVQDTDDDKTDIEEETNDETDAENSTASGKWGVYCNCLTIDSGSGGYVRYNRGKRGTSNYGCGTKRYRAKKTLARYIKQVGSCNKTQCGNKRKYLVTNYPI